MALPLAALGIGAAIGGGLSSLLGGKKEKPKLLMLPEQLAVYRDLLPQATRTGMEYFDVSTKPYADPLTAGLSEFEQTGLKELGDYLQTPLPTEKPLYGLSEAELTKTLEGKEYDPATGPYYEAYRNNIMRELQKAKDRLSARSSARDAFFGGGRLDQEREMEEGAYGSMATTLGQLYENERQRRLEAVPTALQTLGWAEQVPVQRVQAAETLGALPRQIEQQELTARYEDFLRQLQNMGLSAQMAIGLATSNPQYWMPEPADNSGMSNALGQMAMLAMLSGGGGGGGANWAGGNVNTSASTMFA